MPKSERIHCRRSKRTWFTRVARALLAAVGALAATLVPASVSAKSNLGDASTLERRIAAVREAAEEAALKPSKQDSLQTAQWFNWPNWGNWTNWQNWGNTWWNY